MLCYIPYTMWPMIITIQGACLIGARPEASPSFRGHTVKNSFGCGQSYVPAVCTFAVS